METATMRLYEAMFLVDSAQAAGDWDGTMGAIETVMKRADAEIVSVRKWSERRLAYEMGKVARGTYILCYFNADPLRIAGLEKDVRLSESILRVLVLRADERPEGFNDNDMAEKPEVDEGSSTDEAPVAEAPSAPEVKDEAAETPTENTDETSQAEGTEQ